MLAMTKIRENYVQIQILTEISERKNKSKGKGTVALQKGKTWNAI